VRWLLARLDREREVLCDEAAVALGSDPVAYARLLLSLARRPGRLLRAGSPSRPGWLPFLDRRTVSVRIARLLEEAMPSTIPGPPAGRSLLISGLAVAAALILGGLRVRAGSDETTGPPRRTETQDPAVRTAPAVTEKADPEEIRGVILDPEGRPVPRATVVA